jgi:nucleoside-diphosphate-sugar epimerase
MKYLITGYTGFIGKSIVERLQHTNELFSQEVVNFIYNIVT